MIETLIIWTPDLPDGYGAFDEEKIINETKDEDESDT